MASTRVIAVSLALLLAVGCGDDDSKSVDGEKDDRPPLETTTPTDDPGGGTGTTAGSDTTEPGATSAEEEIVNRYIAFWDARFAANSPPNPDDPALREYGMGEALSEVIAEAQANKEAGVEFRPNQQPAQIQRVSVVNVDGDRATVQECVVDDGLVVRQADGVVVNSVVATHNKEGVMQRVDGEWRLASFRVVQRWDGVAGCALAD